MGKIVVDGAATMTKILIYLLLLIASITSTLGQRMIEGLVIDKGNNEPLIGASIVLNGGAEGTITDLEGRFALSVSDSDRLIVSFVGYEEQITRIVTGQDYYEVRLSEGSGVELESVMVIGTRGKPRTSLETAVPIDVIGLSQLQRSPQSDLGQILQYAAPSFHSTKQNFGHGSDHIDPMALRGLGADQTMVLINGKRRHASSLMNVNGTVARGQVGTDLNAIPIAAIERIEVLRDGAAAQYGSDAIAGVINLVLKKNRNQHYVSVKTGWLASPPIIPDELNQLITNPYANIPGLDQATRNDGGGEHLHVNTNFGIEIGSDGGFMNITLNYLKKNPFDRSDDYTLELFALDDVRNGDPVAERAAFNQGDEAAIAAYNAMWVDNATNNNLLAADQRSPAIVNHLNDYPGRRVTNMGGSGSSNTGLFLNGELPLNALTSIYVFGGYNYRLGKASGFVRRPNQALRQSGLWPLGFTPHLNSDIRDISGTIGIHSQYKNWKVDVSNNYGANQFGWTIFNSNNASLGLESPTTFEAGKLQYTQNVLNVDLSKGFEPGFPLHIAFGSEFRLENFKQLAGQDESWQNYNNGLKEAGSQVFPGYQPSNAINKFRYNSGIYADVEAEFSEKFLIGLAGRFENYSDFGNNLSWKLSSRYRVKDFLTIRGAYSTGFRAPSLPQKYFSSYTLQFISLPDGSIDGVSIAHLNDDSRITRQFGIPQLEPETSKNISLGVTAQLDRLSITADMYQIRIKDRIGITGRLTGEDDTRFATILEPEDLTQVQFMTNAVNTKTNGLDLIVSYFLPFQNGAMILNGGANFTSTKIPRDASGSPLIQTGEFLIGYEAQLFNREEVSRIEVAQPQNKIILGSILRIGKLTSHLNLTRFGQIKYIHPSAEPVSNLWNKGIEESRDQTFAAKVITDIDLNYKLAKGVAIGIGSANLFNVYPDRHSHSANYSGGVFPYSRRVTQFGIAGASFYAKMDIAF